MNRFLKESKGAVTVFVTFLLIPAILISGTAVDLTRIYTARSIVSDANQMAANSVLTQYNALLHDLYGLFGVAKDDPILSELVDEYIYITVFGEDSRDTSLGTLQLFYGSDLSLEDFSFAEGKDLSNPDVLRRQIEEYMKYRGPVIVVKELMELLGSSTFKEDAGVINDKLQIDEEIAKLYDKYKELYDAIVAADKCTVVPSDTAGALGNVTSYLVNIRDEFVKLKECYEDWEEELEKLKKDDEDDDDEDDEDDEEERSKKLDDLEAKYNAILENIRSWTVGGKVGKNWKSGGWKDTSNVQGLLVTINNALDRADRFKPKFDTVVTISKELDGMNAELTRMVDDLENRIKSGECNEELAAALTQKDPATGKSVIESYRDILKWKDIESMSVIYKNAGYEYIDGPLKELIRNVIYRDRYNGSAPSLNQSQLENAPSYPGLDISSDDNIASALGRFSSDGVSYDMPAGFVKFGEHPGDNTAFFKELSDMMNMPDIPPVKLYEDQKESGGDNSEKKQRNMIKDLLKLVDSAYEGMTNSPLGAKNIDVPTTGDDDVVSTTDITEAAKDAADNPVYDVIANPYSAIAKAGDYLLLLTYCTSMFSNYTTARPDINGKKIDDISGIAFPKSISGIPISPEVNYFFQSEWEYLYHGSQSADKNLSAVSRLIYVVRVICNYITVFSVKDVTTVVSSIRTAFSWSPPLGMILGELARAAFVAAESLIDLTSLRAGYNVPLIKSGKNGEWVCSPKGVAVALKDLLSDTVSGDDKKDTKGLSYSNYMLFFMLAKGLKGESAAIELTSRTANLIEWNVINYDSGVYCDEEAMSEALSSAGRFKMADMKTDFKLTTTVDMKMLFLSMALAQNFSDAWSIGLSQTMPVSVTDYRGY